jgi:hypothetical protein
MGTSTSSGGSPGSAPLVPPWVPPVPLAPPDGGPPDGDSSDPHALPDREPHQAPALPSQPGLAPSGRFGGARLSLGRFARNGSRADLAAGLRSYASKGLNGPLSGAARMAGSSRTAGRLHGVLDAISRGDSLPSDVALDVASLAGRDAKEIGDAIAEAIRPLDGTWDAEASRDAIAQAIAEAAEQNPGIDLTALTPEQIDFVVERYLAHDLVHRVEYDVGLHVQNRSPDAATAVSRLEDMKGYVRESVAASFRTVQDAGGRMTRSTAASIANKVLEETFRVFADYLP